MYNQIIFEIQIKEFFAQTKNKFKFKLEFSFNLYNSMIFGPLSLLPVYNIPEMKIYEEVMTENPLQLWEDLDNFKKKFRKQHVIYNPVISKHHLNEKTAFVIKDPIVKFIQYLHESNFFPSYKFLQESFAMLLAKNIMPRLDYEVEVL